MLRHVLVVASSLAAAGVHAQGQDSAPYERDIQVIDAMLAGLYSNANQSYFDRRTGREPRHAALTVEIERSADSRFEVSAGPANGGARTYSWTLEADRRRGAVVMLSEAADGSQCTLVWSRSAAEFHARADGACSSGDPVEVVLSKRQLWVSFADEPAGDYRLHRARAFECYADIPGVGGGRDEPYDRYPGLELHDQGGSAWFTSKEGRRLGISLLLVDWPINNYEGAFARDSLVVYLSEELDDGRKELGYAFTVPDADRIGINLKWILVNCYMQSNESVTPFM